MNKPVNELRILESKNSIWNNLFRVGLGLVAFEFATGLWLFFESGLSVRIMTFVLAHTFLGYLLIISLVMLCRRHLAYRRAWPSVYYDSIAVGCILTLATAIGTGIWIHWFGHSAYKWLWWTHIAMSIGHCLLLFSYIIYTLKMGFSELTYLLKKRFRSLVFKIAISIFITCLLFVCIFETVRLLYKSPILAKTVPNYSMVLNDSNPFFPGRLKTVSGGFYQENRFTNSRSCGTTGCHGETVKQWEESTHYRTPGPFVHRVQQLLLSEADANTLFRKTPSTHFELIRNAKPGREVFRLCASCHAPVALLSGGVDPSSPIETFEKHEGVSCKLCHSMTADNGHRTLNIGAVDKLLFEDASSPLGAHLYKTIIRTRPDDHKKMFMKANYKDSKICSGCHFTNQFESWERGPYNKPANHTDSKTCQNCHMAQVKTDNDISAWKKGTISDHRYLSAGFTMAKYFGLEEQFKKTKTFIQDKKMKVDILTQEFVDPDKQLEFVIRVSNIGVGHYFPSGPEADLIESWLQIDILDSNNNLLKQFGSLNKENYLDYSNTKVWRVLNYDSHDRLLENDRHRSWLFAKDVLDLIPPKEFSDVSFKLPNHILLKQDKLTIRARLMYRRPNQEFADWALGKGVFIVPNIEIAQNVRTINFSKDSSLVQKSRMTYKAEIKNSEPGLKKTQRIPSFSTRTVVEDTLIISQARVLVAKGNFAEASQLLKKVSPSLLKHESFARSRYQALLKEIKEKNKSASPTKETESKY